MLSPCFSHFPRGLDPDQSSGASRQSRRQSVLDASRQAAVLCLQHARFEAECEGRIGRLESGLRATPQPSARRTRPAKLHNVSPTCSISSSIFNSWLHTDTPASPPPTWDVSAPGSPPANLTASARRPSLAARAAAGSVEFAPPPLDLLRMGVRTGIHIEPTWRAEPYPSPAGISASATGAIGSAIDSGRFSPRRAAGGPAGCHASGGGFSRLLDPSLAPPDLAVFRHSADRGMDSGGVGIDMASSGMEWGVACASSAGTSSPSLRSPPRLVPSSPLPSLVQQPHEQPQQHCATSPRCEAASPRSAGGTTLRSSPRTSTRGSGTPRQRLGRTHSRSEGRGGGALGSPSRRRPGSIGSGRSSDVPPATPNSHHSHDYSYDAADASALDASLAHMKKRMAAKAARVIDLFKRWDLNGDGEISLAEFEQALPELGFHECTAEQAQRLFAAFDHDGSGDISLRELQRTLMRARATPLKRQPTQAELLRAAERAREAEPCDVAQLRELVRAEVKWLVPAARPSIRTSDGRAAY